MAGNGSKTTATHEGTLSMMHNNQINGETFYHAERDSALTM